MTKIWQLDCGDIIYYLHANDDTDTAGSFYRINYLTDPSDKLDAYREFQEEQEPLLVILGFQLKGEDTAIYSLEHWFYEYNGQPTIPAWNHIHKVFLAEFECQIKEGAKNANIFQEEHSWEPDLMMRCAGVRKPIPSFSLYWGHLWKGTVGILLEGGAVTLTLPTGALCDEEGVPLKTPLYILANPKNWCVDIALFQYQNQIGGTHPGYLELAKINRFLEGKHSVRVLLKDGRQFQVKCFDMTTESLFKWRPGFGLTADGYFYTDRPEGIRADEVVALLYGTARLDVDTASISAMFEWLKPVN